MIPGNKAEFCIRPEMLWSPVLRLLAQWRVLTVQKLEEPTAELLSQQQHVAANAVLHVCLLHGCVWHWSMSGVICHSWNMFFNHRLKGIPIMKNNQDDVLFFCLEWIPVNTRMIFQTNSYRGTFMIQRDHSNFLKSTTPTCFKYIQTYFVNTL